MRTIHEFPRQFFWMLFFFVSSFKHGVDFVWTSVFSTAVEWMVLEFDWNPTMHDFYSQAFIGSISENEQRVLSLRTLHNLSFMTKRNTCFRASSSIEKRELWHLETVKHSLSTAVICLEDALHLKLFTNSFIHLHFLQLTNCRFPLTYSCVLCEGRLKFLLLRWMSASCSEWELPWFECEGSLQIWLIWYSRHI